jgi:pyrroloquinoline quinone (PQQ) biosynthesis protein C
MDPAGTEFWDVHAEMDVDHGDWTLEALALLGADPSEVARAARRGADAWWAFLDEREAEAPGSAELCSHD